MKNISEIIDHLHLENTITLEDIPDIDLYMDQVIQLFEKKYEATTRTKDEKVLTKTMINNYAKGKVFFPIKNKKYSKQHLILLSLIYHLKGTLSINDIKATLQLFNNENDDSNIEKFYRNYLNLFTNNVANFRKDVQGKLKEVEDVATNTDNENSDNLAQILLITSLVNVSNMYRRAAEKLIDDLDEGNGK